ncbi:unnamed protein product, partial [Prorocentrum cordatum]
MVSYASELPEFIRKSVENVRLLMDAPTLLDGRDVTATRLQEALDAASSEAGSDKDKAKIVVDGSGTDDAISKAVASPPAGRALIKKAEAKKERMAVVSSKHAKLVVVLDGLMDVLTDQVGIDYKDAVIQYQKICDKFTSEDFSAQADLVTQVKPKVVQVSGAILRTVGNASVALLKDVSVPLLEPTAPFMMFLEALVPEASVKIWKPFLDVTPFFSVIQWSRSYLQDMSGAVALCKAALSNKGDAPEGLLSAMATLRAMNPGEADIKNLITSAWGDSIFELASKHIDTLLADESVQQLVETATEHVKSKLAPVLDKCEAMYKDPHHLPDDSSAADLKKEMVQILDDVKGLNDKRLNRQLQFFALGFEATHCHRGLAHRWNSCQTAEQMLITPEWILLVSPARRLLKTIRSMHNDDTKAEECKALFQAQDADKLHLDVNFSRFDALVKLVDLESGVDGTLQKIYAQWQASVHGLVTFMEQGCPQWEEWAKLSTFPSEEHIKALVENRAHPKLTPASNKLEAVLSLIETLENQVGGMPVLSDEAREKADKAKTKAVNTVAVTFVTYKMYKHIPSLVEASRPDEVGKLRKA